jgi:hypothetical protein
MKHTSCGTGFLGALVIAMILGAAFDHHHPQSMAAAVSNSAANR